MILYVKQSFKILDDYYFFFLNRKEIRESDEK